MVTMKNKENQVCNDDDSNIAVAIFVMAFFQKKKGFNRWSLQQ